MSRDRYEGRYDSDKHSSKARQYEKLAVAMFVMAGFFGLVTTVLLLASVFVSMT